MDFKKLHEPYKDDASPSIELQIRWLQRLGFQPHQIDQAMITVYTEIEQKERTFANGGELNLYLKDIAAKIRSDELNVYITNLENFEAKMRKTWEESRKVEESKKVETIPEPEPKPKPKPKRPWYIRILDI